jgi:hypothetical protein
LTYILILTPQNPQPTSSTPTPTAPKYTEKALFARTPQKKFQKIKKILAFLWEKYYLISLMADKALKSRNRPKRRKREKLGLYT